MSRYLRHFTAVGDDLKLVSHWIDERRLEVHVKHQQAPVQPSAPVTFRESCRRLFNSEKFQITVVCLVILDAIFVLLELLIDLAIIKVDHGHVAPQVLHYLSLALLTFFMVELVGKIYAYRCEFFHHKFEVFDGVVVIVSFVLDIIYISREDIFDGVGFLILLRLWRVARIINGILVSVKNRADHEIDRHKEENSQLVERVNELQELCSSLEQENDRLRKLLDKNGIPFSHLCGNSGFSSVEESALLASD